MKNTSRDHSDFFQVIADYFQPEFDFPITAADIRKIAPTMTRGSSWRVLHESKIRSQLKIKAKNYIERLEELQIVSEESLPSLGVTREMMNAELLADSREFRTAISRLRNLIGYKMKPRTTDRRVMDFIDALRSVRARDQAQGTRRLEEYNDNVKSVANRFGLQGKESFINRCVADGTFAITKGIKSYLDEVRGMVVMEFPIGVTKEDIKKYLKSLHLEYSDRRDREKNITMRIAQLRKENTSYKEISKIILSESDVRVTPEACRSRHSLHMNKTR